MNIYSLKEENLKFLRILRTCGFFPFKLMSTEYDYAKCFSFGLFVILGALLVLRWYLLHLEIELVVLFVWDVVMLIADQIQTFARGRTCKKLLKLIGEIDERFCKHLNMQQKLEAVNFKLHRKVLFIWIGYGLANLYYPLKQIITNQFPDLFLDSMFRIVTW